MKVTDAEDASSSKSFTVVIIAQPNLTFGAALPRADVGTAYEEQLTRTGGTGPFSYSISAGTLPAGLTLNPATGIISGTPTSGGSYSFTVKVEDSLGQSDTKAATLVVRAAPGLVLTASEPSVEYGTSVALSTTLDPTSATGTVTFSVTNAAGVTSELGTRTVADGKAGLTTTLTAFGKNTVVATYGGDGSNQPVTSSSTVVEVKAYVGQAIITEFRTSGPDGAADQFAEIYNTGAPMPLAGLVLESSSGTETVLPSDAPTLGTYRTYLVAGEDFSLDAFATPDLTTATLGIGGLRLVAPDTAATVTDAAGPSAGFHLGSALPTLAGTPTQQYAFVRIETGGRPNNTGNNGADFALVSSNGERVGGVQSMRGSSSPTGLADPWQHNTQALSYLLDSSRGVEAAPNREYVVGAPGKLEIRRTITNTGTTTITEAKARITALSEANGLPYRGNAPAKKALIRAVNPTSATSQVSVAGRGTVDGPQPVG